MNPFRKTSHSANVVGTQRRSCSDSLVQELQLWCDFHQLDFISRINMGIQGLLPFVQKACRRADISEFSGCSVAIDGHCWLHRAAYACADKLVRGETTTQYVKFCVRMVEMLKAKKIKPIIVFDGFSLPAKSDVQIARRTRRQQMKVRGEMLESEGKSKEARACFTSGFDITSAMVLEVVEACRAKDVDCLVAPFEADAQLTYLLNRGIVHFVITEDSDLIAFGCKRILFKMDGNGSGLLYERRHLHKCLGGRASLLLSPGRSSDEVLFTRFRYSCILSGCDYHPGGLNGVGLQKASKAMMSCSNIMSIDRVLARLPQYLNNMHLTISADYRANFIRANRTFLYQIVFDPLKRQLIPLHPLPQELASENLIYAGHGVLTDAKALKVAIGAVAVNNADLKDDDDLVLPQVSSLPLNSCDIPQKGIWAPTFRIPPPLKSPAKTPLVKRRCTMSQIVELDSEPVMRLLSQTTSILPGAADIAGADCVSPLTSHLSSSKRKLTLEAKDDEISRPKTPKKRPMSWSAPGGNKFAARPVFAGRSSSATAAKDELRKQTAAVHSSYFSPCQSDTSSETLLAGDNSSGYSSGSGGSLESTSESITEQDEDVEFIGEKLVTGFSTTKPAPLPLVERTISLPTSLQGGSSKEQTSKFGLAHFSYRRPVPK